MVHVAGDSGRWYRLITNHRRLFVTQYRVTLALSPGKPLSVTIARRRCRYR
ncbi:hypothetical protein J6590_026914 [Homalodisca vitripennis]|nr:hypothetical protein J6590_026914 [Homalodisca vitripennis]